ncbi:MAG: lysophospholipase [Bdellovibrionales bacterium]|nr:lysophospholipase [Bdellovibrionales bacterium]
MNSQELSQRIMSGIVVPAGFPTMPSDWIASEQQILSTDGKRKLFVLVFSKGEAFGKKGSKNGHRAVAVLHGMGEHGGRYQHFTHYLQSNVDTVVCLDHLGHGRSEGLRGHIDHFDRLTDDAGIFLDFVHARLKEIHQKSEVHLFAHSLGGHIGLRLLLKGRKDLASAAISAPFLGLKGKVPAVKAAAAKVLAKIGPWIQLDTALDVNTISRDPAVLKAYQTDRLVHSKMTPGFWDQTLHAIEDTLANTTLIQAPVEFFIPLADGLIDADVSTAYFDRMRALEKSLKTFPGCHHEIFNDLGKEKAFSDLNYWIQGHSA